MARNVAKIIREGEAPHQYARDVLSGKVPACKWVRLACQRHLNDLKRSRSKDFPYQYHLEQAARVFGIIEELPHIKGAWAGRGEKLKLWPFQKFIVGSLFGWIEKGTMGQKKFETEDRIFETGIRRFQKAKIYLPRKQAKALAVDTLIPTPEGYSTMGDLRAGDFVFGLDGGPIKVKGVSDVFLNHDCYEVEFSTGEKIIADSGHQWLTDARKDRDKFRDSRPSLRTTKEVFDSVLLRGERNHRVRVVGGILLPEKELLIPSYVLGCWLGDGHSDGAAITVSDKDIFILERIRNLGVPVRKNRPGITYALTNGVKNRTYQGKSIKERLRKIGVLNNKHVPIEYLRASFDQRMELLRGLMDTDGSCFGDGTCSFTSTKKRLALDVHELVSSLGFKATFTDGKAMLNGRYCGPVYHVKFYAYSDCPVFHLERKKAKQKSKPSRLTRIGYRQVKNVRKVGSLPVKCISIDSKDGMFLVGRSFIPTHNSTLAAAIGNYMLACDAETGAEVYSGATGEKQAHEVFDPARAMLIKSPFFCEYYGVETPGPTSNNLHVHATNSKFETLIGKPGEGASPSCAIHDEYHEHDTDAQVDAMDTGMVAREQPLQLIISTAGLNLAGPCFLDFLDCQKLLEGLVGNERTFAIIYTIDQEDKWDSEEALRKANPLFDDPIVQRYLLSKLEEARNAPRKQNTFKTKHLNMWVSARAAYYEVDAWRACHDERVTLDAFLGQSCIVALDLASKVDLAAMEILFRMDQCDCDLARELLDEGIKYVRFGKYWLPESRLELPENEHYRTWKKLGWLDTTEGNIIDFNEIRDSILGFCSNFQVEYVAYDPNQATMLVTSLISEGVTCIEVRPTVANFSEPMKTLEALIQSKAIRHDDDPIMAWAISNVVARENAKEEVYPRKEVNEAKIDPVVAHLMALARWELIEWSEEGPAPKEEDFKVEEVQF